MSTTKFQNTLFATSAPLSLTQGFALFPSGAGPFTPGNQVSGIDDSFEILNESDSFGYFRLDAYFSIGVFFGMAGPSFAMRFHALGETQDNGVAWAQMSDDEEQTGVLFGAYLGANFGFSFSVGISVWGFSWSQTLVSENLSFQYDLIGNIAAEINSVLEDLGFVGSLLVPVNVPIGANGVVMPSQTATAWGIVVKGNNQLASGSVTLTPAVDLYVDIAPDIPYVSDLASAAKILGGTLSFGPTLDISVPININVVGIMADANTYSAGSSVTAAQIAAYNQTLANTLQSQYASNNWASPGAAGFLTQAQQDVANGQYPTVAAWFADAIPAAGGTVPAAPTPTPIVVPGAPTGALLFSGGPAVGPATIANLTIQMQHTVSFVITAGFSVDAGIDSFNYSNTWSINILSLLGLPQSAGPFNDQITAANGNTVATPLALKGAVDRVESQLADIVFEPMLPA